MTSADGSVREPYLILNQWLQEQPKDALGLMASDAEAIFRRLGITFAVYGSNEGTEKLIPFDIIPRIISAVEWRRLSKGIEQRVRALNAFLPRLSHELMGEELRLPTIATWWCGQPAERQHVVEHFDELMVGPAFATGLAIDDHKATFLGATLDPDQRAAMLHRLEQDGSSLVGQEPVRLSTAPVHVNGKLEPRPITLRVYAARTADGWSIMPGGFARVGSTTDTSALSACPPSEKCSGLMP